jgi:hypothetical protein
LANPISAGIVKEFTIWGALNCFEDRDLGADLRVSDFIVFLSKIDDYQFDSSHEGCGLFFEANGVDRRVGACADRVADSVFAVDNFLARLERDRGVHWKIKMEKKIFKSMRFKFITGF